MHRPIETAGRIVLIIIVCLLKIMMILASMSSLSDFSCSDTATFFELMSLVAEIFGQK